MKTGHLPPAPFDIFDGAVFLDQDSSATFRDLAGCDPVQGLNAPCWRNFVSNQILAAVNRGGEGILCAFLLQAYLPDPQSELDQRTDALNRAAIDHAFLHSLGIDPDQRSTGIIGRIH